LTKNQTIKNNRVPWNHIFLLEALLWSNRSHDSQTKCGCVLVRNKTVLSTGYNGFISNIDDTQLPNTRPLKYDYIIHAEHNAILNCTRNGICTLGSTAYITSEPCNNCLQYMWQAGVNRVIYSDFSKPQMVDNNKHNEIQKKLLKLMNEKYSFELEFISSTDIQYL
jgi:dCMP deaminase